MPDNRNRPSLPALAVFLLRHAAVGFALAALFVAGLLAFDLGGIGTLVLNSDVGVPAVMLLTMFIAQIGA